MRKYFRISLKLLKAIWNLIGIGNLMFKCMVAMWKKSRIETIFRWVVDVYAVHIRQIGVIFHVTFVFFTCSALWSPSSAWDIFQCNVNYKGKYFMSSIKPNLHETQIFIHFMKKKEKVIMWSHLEPQLLYVAASQHWICGFNKLTLSAV